MIACDISTSKERSSLHWNKGEFALRVRCPATELGKGEPMVFSAPRKLPDKSASHGAWGPFKLAI